VTVVVVVPKPTVRRGADDDVLEAKGVIGGGRGLCMRFSFDLGAKLLMFKED
jgi:hypothetical protein